MLIAVRAKVESVEHWRERFKTHVDLFKSQGVSIAHMGAANDETVVAVFETNNPDEFIKIFNDSETLALYIITVPKPQREKINNNSDLSNLFVMMFK